MAYRDKWVQETNIIFFQTDDYTDAEFIDEGGVIDYTEGRKSYGLR